eukprot:maker-scaffold_23-snap-gene-5.2-mRNA-1 protein AED:0.01 eAED:0.01 QI:101/0.5/0.66/1/1/1/3/70/154
MASYTADKSVETLQVPGFEENEVKLRFRTKPKKHQEVFLVLILFLSVTFCFGGFVSVLICWNLNPKFEEEMDVEFQGSYCKAGILLDTFDIFSFSTMIPFLFAAGGSILMFLLFFFGLENSDRGLIRGKSIFFVCAYNKTEKKYTKTMEKIYYY